MPLEECRRILYAHAKTRHTLVAQCKVDMEVGQPPFPQEAVRLSP